MPQADEPCGSGFNPTANYTINPTHITRIFFRGAGMWLD